ncbi:MAG TPA: AMP-binding protein, partial [Planctomycetota bacterium]
MQDKVWHRNYDPGVPREIEFEDISLSGLFQRSVEKFPDRPAVIFMNCRLSYRQLKGEVDRLATALAGMGVRPDTKVAIHMPNLPQTVISVLAVLSLGAQAVMTNPLYVEREIEHQWHDAGVEVAITTDWLYAQRIKGIRDKLPVRNYLIATIAEYLRFPLNLLAPFKLKKADPPLTAHVAVENGVYFFRKLLRATTPAPPRPMITLESVALLQYTGGTTGVSKGAMLSHGNLSCNVQQLTAWFPNLEPGGEVILAALPYFHVFGINICLLWPCSVGAAMVLMPNPRDIPLMIKNVAKHKATLMPAVPAIFNAVNQFPGVEKFDLTSVKSCFSGSAPLPIDVMERFERLTGGKIVEGFGLTETSPVATANPLSGLRKAGSIGLPLPNTVAKIVDAELGDTELPVGKEGELILRGPQVMK